MCGWLKRPASQRYSALQQRLAKAQKVLQVQRDDADGDGQLQALVRRHLARATQRLMVAALFSSTSSGIDSPAACDIGQQACSGNVKLQLFAEHVALKQACVQSTRPQHAPIGDDLVLHDGAGSA